MALTQGRACGALTGRRYGSFAGRDASHPVEVLTQARRFGAQSGSRYGSFAGKAQGAGNRDRLTQARAFGAFTGRRYGSFDGRTEQATETPPAPTPPIFGGRIRLWHPGSVGGDRFQNLRGPASAFDGYLRGRRRVDLTPIVGRAKPWRREEGAREAERLEREEARRQVEIQRAIEARDAAERQAENERLAELAAESLRQSTAQAAQALAAGAVQEALAGTLGEVQAIEAAQVAQRNANRRKAVLMAALAATAYGRIVIKVEKA